MLGASDKKYPLQIKNLAAALQSQQAQLEASSSSVSKLIKMSRGGKRKIDTSRKFRVNALN